MVEAKILLGAAGGSLVGAAVAQISQLDAAAVCGYVGALGLAGLGIYSRWREERRKQDVLDRQARQHDCEDKLAVVIADLNQHRDELQQIRADNQALRSDLDRWRERLKKDGDPDSPSSSPKRSGPGCTSSPDAC